METVSYVIQVTAALNPLMPVGNYSYPVSRNYGGKTKEIIIIIMTSDVSLSDSKCWNLVAKTQRWAKMG